MNHLDAFGQAVLKQAIDDLFKSEYFSICKLDNIIKVGRLSVDHAIYRQLRALHCVDYADMSPDIKSQLQQKVIQCLRGDLDFQPSLVFAAITAEGKNFTPGIEDEQARTSNVRRLKFW